MPYISQKDRNWIQSGYRARTIGELNYQITQLVLGFLGHRPNYTEINQAVGVLECAKLELYRRIAAPYEDGKCEENGDVYE